MTAASFVGFTSVKSQLATVVSTAPAGLQAGDHQLFIVTIGTGSESFAATPASPAVTQIGAEQAQTGDTAKARIFYSTTATGNVTFSKASGTRLFHVLRVVWRGGAGFDVASAQFAIRAAGASHALPAQTTTVADQKVIAVYWTDAGLNTVQTLTGPGAPWVQRYNASETTTFPERSSIGVWEQDKNPPGAVNGNVSNSLGEDGMVFTIQLAAASAAAPVVDGGADASVVAGTAFTRTATATDSPTSWAWTIFSGPSGAGTTIGTAAALSWTPTVAGTYVLRVTATGAGGTSAPDDVTVTVTAANAPPVVNAGADASVAVGSTFTRTATESSGQTITARSWTIVSGPTGAGTTIGTAAALSWTPPGAGTYVLRYTATNASGTSAPDDVTVTVSAAVTTVSIVQSGKVFATTNGATTDAVALPAAPAAGALVLTGTSVNKNATTLTVAAPFTKRDDYFAAQVSGALADAVGAQTASWTKGAQQSALGIFETNLTNATFRQAGAFPDPVNDLGVTSVAGDLGAAAAPGVVFALVGVDSSWDVSLALGGTWPDGLDSVTWTNGYAGLAVVQTSSTDGDGVGGAAFLLGYKIVSTGDATSTTCSWASTTNAPDQAYMILSNYDVSSSVGTPLAVNAGPAASAAINSTFTRTASETGGVGVTSRAWTIVSGPTGAGTTIGTAAALSWTVPATAGTYVLRYTAIDANTTATSDVTVTVTTGTPGTVTRNPRVGVDKIGLRLNAGVGDVRVDFSLTSDMANPISSVNVTPGPQGDAHVPIPALAPDTLYYFRPFRGGSYIGTVRSFTTMPGAAQTSFKIAYASCRQQDADAPVLSALPARGADMMMFIGDLHYENISSTDASLYRSADDEPYTQTYLAQTLTTIPNTQVWDDHDFCGDGSWRGSTGATTVAGVFRERVPTPDLVQSSGGVYHTFKVWGGRVRIIMLDCRYYRDQTGTATDGTMLGTAQLSWLQGLLAAPDTALTFLVSSVGWQGGADSGQDHWGWYQDERATIAGWISASPTEVVLLCGDMHRMAIATPANGTPGGVHVWHAAALHQFDNGVKGGPYAATQTYYEPGSCGLIELAETGQQITATFRGLQSGTTDWSGTDSVTVTTLGAVEPGRMLLMA